MCFGVICHMTYYGFLLSCPKFVDAAHSNYEAKPIAQVYYSKLC